jgi:3-oxoadipate enol-lactonase
MFSYAASVKALIDHLGIDSAHIVGSSLGGMIGLALAISSPASVRSLVAADVRVDAPGDYKKIWDNLIDMTNKEGMRAISDFMVNRWFGEAAGDRDGEVKAVADTLKSTSPEGFITAARAIREMNFIDQLKNIACPTLLLVGENDGVLPGVMSDMKQLIEKSEYVEIKGAGHLPGIDKPQDFLVAVNGFLQDQ